MKKILHPCLLAPLTVIATAGVVVLPSACAQQAGPPAPVATVPATPGPELVSGLPDFTRLVDKVGPAVVSVEVRTAPRGNAMGRDPMAEIFRRFGMPMPPGMQGPRGSMPQQPRGVSLGTGFLISADGYVLTNHHVVDNADEISIRLSDRRELKAKLVGSDEQSDVALLKVEAKNLPALSLGDSARVKPGQWVVAIGSPYGLDHSVTAGIVSAIGRSTGNQRYVPFIQTDVAINRGNSGGPLLNTRGEVVGINSQIFSVSGGFQGISFAIPIDTAMNAVEQLKKSGQVRRGMLGVNMNPEISSGLARSMGLPDTRGALVADVQPGGAAAKAGIQPGDVVRSFNGTPIEVYSDLPPMVGALPPGSKVKLGIWRDGRERGIEVVLGEAGPDRAPGFGRRDDAPATGAPSPSAAGLLGLRIVELDADDRRQLGLKADEGVGVVGVESRAAREAQVLPGDVILSVGRTPVGSAAALRGALASVKAGDTVTLRLAGIPNRSAPRFVAIRTGGD
ncbi:DegQ family serine endoprotease [Lysobacter pythonis]|uniref:Probable periplasmic serine endoprotease DegP-like n=1 Tax=Solilutibacter pythonis TaxID=2483112 RepID=A0A3M2I4D5_9GAMM|nr:DegQ family serine endoprotease [Lysobacter pythonis]RMH93064.1 DegQ family serine endoprotease [Lysobacter pythonis]